MPLTPTTAAPSSGIPVHFAPNVATTDGGPGVFGAFFPGNITSLAASDTTKRIYISTANRLYQIENPDLNPATAFYNGVSFAFPGVANIRDFSFNHNGTQIIASDLNEQNVRQLTLTEPYNLLGAVQTSTKTIPLDFDMGGISYGNPNPAGVFQSFYIYHDIPPFGSFSLFRYDMSDPSIVSTGVQVASDSTSIVRPYNLTFDDTGYRYFVCNSTFTVILTEVHLPTAWSLGNELTLSQFPLPFSTIAMFDVKGVRMYTAVVQSPTKRVTAFISSFIRPGA